MFEIGRELKRLFVGERMEIPTDGLTGGDSGLLELLDLSLLSQEARSADVAAGRISAKDRPQRRLEAAIVWREVARRTGDAVALRKAAAIAESAAAAFETARRMDGWARARCEQAFCGLLGAELFGDPGLDAAAELAFRDARNVSRGGLAAPLADAGIAAVEGRRKLTSATAAEARALAQAFTAPIAALEGLARRVATARPLAAEARLIRSDLLCAWGARLKDAELLEMAVADAKAAAARTDSAFEPLTFVRAEVARGQAMVLLGEMRGDAGPLCEAAGALSNAIEQLTEDHSPLDWARAQVALGRALQALGEAGAEPNAFDKAIACYDRANGVLKDAMGLTLRGLARGARAVCLARAAEVSGDIAVLDAAEAALKQELARLTPKRDPVGWALSQMHLARIYETRLDLNGGRGAERAAAVLALDCAFEVFAEHGMRSLSLVAHEALERVRAPSQATS